MKNRIKVIVLFFVFLYQINFSLDTIQVKEIGHGVIYYKLIDTLKPLSINVIKVDLKNKNNFIDVAIPYDTLGVGGLTVSQTAKLKLKNGEKIIASVNGDFFGGEPYQSQNSIVVNGELIKGANLNRSLFMIDENKKPNIDKFHFEGELKIGEKKYKISGFNNINPNYEFVLINQKLQNYTSDFHPYKYKLKLESDFRINKEMQFKLISENENNADEFILLSKSKIDQFDFEQKVSVKLFFKKINQEIKAMIGGLPGLFKNSKLIKEFVGIEDVSGKSFVAKNPRTAIGYNSAKDTLTIVTVDGRKPNHSMGMSLYELSDLMIKLGCTDALNLDGGGSTAMSIRDSVINKPSDFTGERKVYSTLMVFSKNNSEMEFTVTPKLKEIMENHSIDFDIKILDEWGFETQLDSTKVKVSLDGIEGKLNNQFEFFPQNSGKAKLIWEYKNLKDTTEIVVIPGE